MRPHALILSDDGSLLSEDGFPAFEHTISTLRRKGRTDCVWVATNANQRKTIGIANVTGCHYVDIDQDDLSSWCFGPRMIDLQRIAALHICHKVQSQDHPGIIVCVQPSMHDLWNDYILPAITKIKEFNIGEVFSVDRNMVENHMFRVVRTSHLTGCGCGVGDRAVSICEVRR